MFLEASCSGYMSFFNTFTHFIWPTRRVSRLLKRNVVEHKGIPGVTSQYLCFILSVRSKSQVKPTLNEKKLHKGMHIGKWKS